ncbi:polysaccharide pyruvyl transferase family protein [Microbacterium pumilum]|uniref:Polysaccharide pyruvyl transferase domain-containing protein n=1 Tax=Microbacterium pumilum TaxID=344165 RepID=A0ABP5DV69_9MICO
MGAYERDNFGDLLYVEVTRGYLASATDTTFAAPFAGDMTAELGVDVPAAGPLLDAEHVDAIWTVGGEVGATDIDYVYRTRFGQDAATALAAMSADDRTTTLRRELGGAVFDAPYVPRPSAHSGTLGADLILNSVGIGSIPHLSRARRYVLEAVLREATYISVRDPRSDAYLTRIGVPHRLAPDLIHTLALNHPRPAASGGWALIHLSDHHLREHTPDAWVRAIHAASSLRGMPLRFFLAGTAPGHDSQAAADRLRDALLELDHGRDIEISTARSTWPRVDEIADSAVWIGGSLHGRIVAQVYRVPRASLAKGKVDAYAETWDADMPSGVTPQTLDAAVTHALGSATHGDVDDLAERAERSIRDGLDAVLAGQARSRDDRMRELLAIRAAEAADLHSWSAQLETAYAHTKTEYVKASADRDALRKELDAVHEEAPAEPPSSIVGKLSRAYSSVRRKD